MINNQENWQGGVSVSAPLDADTAKKIFKEDFPAQNKRGVKVEASEPPILETPGRIVIEKVPQYALKPKAKPELKKLFPWGDQKPSN